MIAGYCRVSTREQAIDSNALEQQKIRVMAKGVKDSSYLFVDIQTGRSDRRPEYLKMKALVERGVIKQVIVTRLDRLTRSLRETAKMIDFFLEHGCNLVALDDAIDLYSASGKFQVHILGALSQMESDRLSERVKHGKAHERSLGRYSGGVPLGYKVDANKILQLNEDLHPSGKSYREIAIEAVDAYLEIQSLSGALRTINAKYGERFSTATAFSHWLSTGFLAGHLKSRRSDGYIQNHHVPLISEATYQSVLALLKKNKSLGGYGCSKKYPLSSLVVCGECKTRMVIQKNSNKKSREKANLPPLSYYYCKKATLNGCKNKKWVREDYLELSVIDAISAKKTQLADIVVTSTTSEENNARIADLESKVNQFKAIGSDDIILEAIAKLTAQIESLKSGSGKHMWEVDLRRQRLEQFTADPQFWHALSQAEKREFYHALVSRLVVLNGQVVDVFLTF
jgi:DNA invertase Pin-like site-specific DNA recombinase